MSVSTDAILAYGYHLGGPDADWEIENTVEKYGYEVPAGGWYDPENEEVDFAEAAMNRLLAAAGFTETDWQAAGFFERRDKAEKDLGVTIVTHCSYTVPMYVLAAWSTEACRGYPKTISPTEFVGERLLWNARLEHALKSLDLTPKQSEPTWILCSLTDLE